MNALVTYRLENSLAILSMDDGKANALSTQMFTELNAALDRAAADRAPVILTGRPGMFSAGFHMPTLMAGGTGARELVLAGFKLSARLLSTPQPVVIASSGHAIAMGAFLILSGDYRIGAEGAFKIIANEVAIGLTMPHSAIEICRQRLAPAHFQRAVNNSELYSPAESVVAGFLDRVVPPENLMDEAVKVTTDLAKLNQPAHAATKLRARAQALTALRAAMEADDADLKASGLV